MWVQCHISLSAAGYSYMDRVLSNQVEWGDSLSFSPFSWVWHISSAETPLPLSKSLGTPPCRTQLESIVKKEWTTRIVDIFAQHNEYQYTSVVEFNSLMQLHKLKNYYLHFVHDQIDFCFYILHASDNILSVTLDC